MVNSVLNKMKEMGSIALDNLKTDNRVINMINSGSKGKLQNIAQTVSCLVTQNVDSKRIPYGLIGRTLPHYYKYDIHPRHVDSYPIRLSRDNSLYISFMLRGS